MSIQTVHPDTDVATEDLYPSRIQSSPEILDRQDPVIYGGEADGPLSAEQLESFDRDGCLVLPRFLSEREVAACQAELSSLCNRDDVKHRPEAIIEPDNSELRSLFAVHDPEISPFFSRVAADERVAGMAMQILGGEVYIHQSRVNLKPGFNGKEFHWHSDFETWHVEDGMPRMRAVSCSLLLTENYEYNGPLLLIPGSHKKYVPCVGETPDDHYRQSLRKQEYGVPDHDSLTRFAREKGIRSGTGPAGTLVLFDCNTMHGSSGNITPFPRNNLFLVFNSTWNGLVQPFCGKKPRPEFIASRADCPPVVPLRVDYGCQ